MLKQCPVCQSHSTALFLTRTSVPVHQNLIMKDQKLALHIQKGDLRLTQCHSCGFVFNQAFDEKKLSYGEFYDNTQDLSFSFKEHLNSLIHHLIFEKNVRNCHITEVGCGKGGFLKRLVENAEFKNRGYGFDPTYVGPDSLFDGKVQFKRSFYNEEASSIPTDVVICRHVIEHIPDPLAFLKLIKRTLTHSPQARLFFETPCLKWILKNQVIWDFFYEHCSYFTMHSLSTLFELAGFHVESICHVFGGQYLWLEATLSSTEKIGCTKDPEVANLIQNYCIEEETIKNGWQEKIVALSHTQKVALWGAGAKGVTFANLIDPERKLIDCIIDINPRKQNYFTPGSGHPIVSYETAAMRGVNTAFVMNGNYMRESHELLVKAGIPMELL